MKTHQQLPEERYFKYKSVGAVFHSKLHSTPHSTFIISIYKNKTETCTYNQFAAKVVCTQKYFQDKGLKKGDVINIIIENSEAFLILYISALSMGVVVCPVNYNMMPPEILYIINDSKARMVFVDEEYAGKVISIKEHLPAVGEIVIFSYNSQNEWQFFNINSIFQNADSYATEHSLKIDACIEDPGVIIYTSGTSGNPKGVILTQANMLADAQAIAEWFSFDSDTRTLCILPLFHNNGQIVTFLAPLWAGGSTVMIKGNVSLYSFWDIVSRYKVTWTSVIPTILSVLLSLRKKPEANSLHGIICGGALLPERVQLEFEENFGVPVYEGYGLTETTSFSCFNPKNISLRKIGSVGVSLPVNEMCIMDEEETRMEAEITGEICIRGYNVFSAYLNLPEKSISSVRNGWFHSGDFGHRDKDGFYYIEGRKDDLIIKGGENIYPGEIENVVYNHPKIKDCAALGVPHPLWGEDIIMFVELKNGEKSSQEEIRKFCEDKIAVYKIPGKIFFIGESKGLNEIPKGPTKKILRSKLLEYYNNKLNMK